MEIQDFDDDEVLDNPANDIQEEQLPGGDYPTDNVGQQDEPEQQQAPQQNVMSSDEALSLLGEAVRNTGVKDPNRIPFATTDGRIVERSFLDLTPQERLNVLKTPNGIDGEITDEELEFLNHLRDNDMTVSDYLGAMRQDLESQYIVKGQEQKEYDIDEMDDDEVMFLDLLAKDDNISDEEAYEMMDNYKTNPRLYAKMVESTRTRLKQEQEQIRQQKDLAVQQQREDKYRRWYGQVENHLTGLEDVFGLPITMSDNERREVIDFMTQVDSQTGMTPFQEAMADPRNQAQVATMMLYGADINDAIGKHYTGVVNNFARRYDAQNSARVLTRPQTQIQDKATPRKSSGYLIQDMGD